MLQLRPLWHAGVAWHAQLPAEPVRSCRMQVPGASGSELITYIVRTILQALVIFDAAFGRALGRPNHLACWLTTPAEPVPERLTWQS